MTYSTDPLPPPHIDDVSSGRTTDDICDASVALNDPPPPYPSRERRHRTPRSSARHNTNTPNRIHTTPHHQLPSSDSQNDRISPIFPCPRTDDIEEPTETTLLLAPPVSPTSRRAGDRPRTYSHTSTSSSVAPSLAQTVLSLFQTDDGDERFMADDIENRSFLSSQGDQPRTESVVETGFFSVAAWKRYFRPLGKKAYYSSLLHLALINFPFALAAWVYLFVFTVTGTTLLMALPLGAVLCFLNLLGARIFSRGELALQYRFHYPLSYPPPYPPRPIFTRYREPTVSEIESGRVGSRPSLVREASFYKNTYAMFTDSTSYQALFYFLVIKPAITLLLTIAIWAFAVPLLLLVLPAPAVLRASRKLGVWQANVAVEGLYLAVQ